MAILVRRLYVEKKPGFDVAAQGMLKDLRENFALSSLRNLRIAIRYDVDGLSEEDYAAACQQIFSEPPVDIVYQEEIPVNDGEWLLAVEYLPGQYDQRADNAAQCVQLLTQKERPQIKVATVYLFEGLSDDSQKEQVRNYCINPVDSRQAEMAKPATLEVSYAAPDDVPVLSGFIQMNQQELTDLWQRLGLAMSRADLAFCQEYFAKEERRDPTFTEIKVIDTYWSDHCRHTTFQTEITGIQVEEGKYQKAIAQTLAEYQAVRQQVGREDKPLTLMDMATINTKELSAAGQLPDLDVSEEINACSIKADVVIDGEKVPYLIMFKNETHNHPTEIEPFGGAATCIGGAIRDPLSGRAYVYQAMRVTGAADPTEPVENTIPGKLPQRKITVGAAQGYSSYGNQIGLATGLVDEVYHPGYKAKRMEIGAVMAAAPAENVVRETPAAGDIVILLGGATGRDGCGGATGSSKAHDENSILECGAEVQKGNPITERKLQRLYRNPNFTKLVKRCNDFGAGGVSVAIGELADGLAINLDAVPKKYEGLDGTELAISESQERMAVVVRPEHVDLVLAFAALENLDATPVAMVTDHNRMEMYWRGKAIVDISRDFLNTNGVRAKTSALVKQPSGKYFVPKGQGAMAERWITAMADLNNCAKRGLIERFDSSIGAGTVLMPEGGKYQLTPSQVMAAKIPLLKGNTDTVTMMSYGFDPYLSAWSPYHGGIYAVVESLAKLAAAGGDAAQARLTMQEFFGSLQKEPARWGQPVAALLGAQFAMRKLGVPAIGGKDSMSGTFKEIDVPPTLCAFGVVVGNANHIVSPEWKQAGHIIALLPVTRDDSDLPDFDSLRKNFDFLAKQKGLVYAASTVGGGGIAVAVAKAAFGNGLGVELSGDWTEDRLFTAEYGSILLEVADINALDGLNYQVLGTLLPEPVMRYQDITLPLERLQTAWLQRLEPVFPTQTKQVAASELPLWLQRSAVKPVLHTARPRVCIPVFPGTNCEYDLSRAFEKAGALTQQIIFRNRSTQEIEESIHALASALQGAQIFAIPGGFSAGDEPDGSGKFIATTLRNPKVAEALEELLHTRDGLVLGICNGFQALVKVGLVPYGEIRDMTAASPTLTFNEIGRHASKIVHTKVISQLSPWFALTEAGAIHRVPISHGEGRFFATEEELRRLAAQGQIATAYVDEAGQPSMLVENNPNGSLYAIEGITSPDGRVLGKMGHSERLNPGLYQNVPGDYDQKIFQSGVAYFK